MNDSPTKAALVARVLRSIPRDTVRSVHPKTVEKYLEVAWENGWRDADWIANYILAGIDHHAVSDTSAVLVSRLRDVADMQCPSEVTPTPPSAVEVLHEPGHTPASRQNTAAYLSQCRRTIRAIASPNGGSAKNSKISDGGGLL